MVSVQGVTKYHAESGHVGNGKYTGVTKSHAESGLLDNGKCTGVTKSHTESVHVGNGKCTGEHGQWYVFWVTKGYAQSGP
jgi:uncharacterized low-complexity protein